VKENIAMSNDTLNLVCIIMAGGVGTRFWPLSTQERPKQFLKLMGDRSLLQKSFERISDLVSPERVLVLTNAAFVHLVREQLPELPPENVVGEPMRRDTAAAVCLGALLCRKRFGNPVIATLTADHVIEPVGGFHKTLLSAARVARESGALYTFAIPPTYPATGYGYLELGQEVTDDQGIEHYELLSFMEKPDLETARRYMESQRFYWNSGMFVWTAEAILREIENHLAGHMRAIAGAVGFDGTPRWEGALKEAFDPLTAISIDYAVMEKASAVRCVAARFSWTDVGGWQALRDFLDHDEHGNCSRGEVHVLDAKGNLVFCEDPGETVMLVGVENLVAVRAGRRTLIVHKDHAERVKELVENMKGSS
jgi:mannose-1-phosphate guanylyltransferase